MNSNEISKIANKEYQKFTESCFNEAKERTGSALAAMNEMQGFDYPDYIETDTSKLTELSEEYGVEIPTEAIGVQVLNSTCELGKWIFPSDSGEEVKMICRELYY